MHPGRIGALLCLALGVGVVGCSKKAKPEGERIPIASNSKPHGGAEGGRGDAAGPAEASGTSLPQTDAAPYASGGIENLGIEPELLVDLALGGQVYEHVVTEGWFFLTGVLGRVAGGTGLFRMPKQAGVVPELISEDWSGSTFANFYFDGEYVAFLDNTRLMRFKEDLSDWTTVELERGHYYLGGDTDSLFAMGDNCGYVTLLDRSTLTARVFEPVPGGVKNGGGAFGITSDGDHLYCTGAGVLHTIDKRTGEITTVATSWGGDPASPSSTSELRFGGFFFDDGQLNVNSDDSDYWGYVDVGSGVFNPVSRGGWNGIRFRPEPGTPYVYFVENNSESNVWRYDRGTNIAVRLMPKTLSIRHSMAMDSTHIYFATGDNPFVVGELIGIARVKKP